MSESEAEVETKLGKKLLIWGVAIAAPILVVYMNLGFFMNLVAGFVMTQVEDLPAPAQHQIVAIPNSKLSISRVAPIPDNFPDVIKESFVKYTQVIAPNGKTINIFAQTDISDSQILHARDVLVFFLTDLPGSKYGSDKSDIADQMANNNGILMLLNGSDGDMIPPMINAQPLYDTELIVEGSKAYIENDYENHRDATLEEILHFVHDSGIGVDFAGAPKGVRPAFQAEIRKAATNALPENEGIWASVPQMADWLEEIRAEGSITQEYLASVVDCYYGLWAPWDERPGGMWGGYVAKTRADVIAKDPLGAALMPLFFGDYLTYNAHLESDFDGTFIMAFDPENPYTHKSQYLKHVTLTGRNNTNISANDQDNTLAGNAGDNVIDGKAGMDTVAYPRAEGEYTVTHNDDGTITVVGDGMDTLINIENLAFSMEDYLEAN